MAASIFGTIMAMPYLILWYVMWISSSLFRPILLATIICMAINPKAAKIKIGLIATTFQYMFTCKDKKWKKDREDPSPYFKDYDPNNVSNTNPDIETKTIIFVRHGESTWNDTFNKGDRKMGQFILGFIPGLFQAFATEWYFMVSGKADESWFFDAPLSKKGIKQAEGLQKFLQESKPEFATPKEARLIKILKGEVTEGETKRSQITSSNLRRAVSTICIGLSDRLDKHYKDDKILILSELQEISVNPDALSIHPPKQPLVTSFTDSDEVKEIYANQTDTALNTGNKSIKSNGLLRMDGFNSIVFDNIHASSVVATGHSLWFKSFFQTFLPPKFEHVSKKKKLINGGAVGFTLLRTKKDLNSDNSEYVYMIDPNSLVVLYGGF